MVYRQVVRILKKAGWVEVGVRSSHHHFKDASGKRRGKATVPYHSGDIPQKVISSIERQTGLSLKR